MSDDSKCICYVSMTVEELKRLPENLLVEAVVGSIPTLLKEKNYFEIVRRAAIVPGNKNKLLEILRKNETGSGLSEKELAVITKMHALNIYHAENAIIMSLHELINKLFERRSDELKAILKTIESREEGKQHWTDLIKKSLLENKNMSVWYENTGEIIQIVNMFGLKKEEIAYFLSNLIEKNKKDYPYECLLVASRFLVKYDSEEYLKIADDIIRKANSEKDYYYKAVERAIRTYELLVELGHNDTVGERNRVSEAYNLKGSQAAIKKASKIVGFDYIPRGWFDTFMTRVFG